MNGLDIFKDTSDRGQLVFTFDYQNNQNEHINIRTLEYNGETWFVAIDVRMVLGIKQAHRTLTRIDEDDRHSMTVIDKIGRKQKTTVINESGLYQVIFQSRKEEAKRFKKWVTREVIPTIRKQGYYGKPKYTHLFVRRFNANWDRTDRGYFSVISETFVRLYGKFEQIGYSIPDKTKKNVEIRPDNSIGKGFSNYMKSKYNNLDLDKIRKTYSHILPNRIEVECFQYNNNYLGDFIDYIENIWLIESAHKYLKNRVPDSIIYLAKVIKLIENKK